MIRRGRDKNELQDVLLDPSDTNHEVYLTYCVQKSLGRGSFGCVYQCVNIYSSQPVAIKVVDKKIIKPSALTMMLQEADILFRLNHPSIVKVLEQRQSIGKYYIIMELLDLSLTQLIEQQNISVRQIASIMKQICQGIEYIHQQNIIHRDLKPDNILVKIQPNGDIKVKIIDFGLSHQKNDTVVHSTQNIGTLLYMAPEMIFSQTYNQSVDIYSVGIIMYYMFSGGQHPIWSQNDNSFTFCQKLRDVDFEAIQFPLNMSKQTIQFFLKTAAKQSENRFTAQQSLKHHWITGDENIQEPRTMSDVIKAVENIKKFESIVPALMFLTYLTQKCQTKQSQRKPTFRLQLKLASENSTCNTDQVGRDEQAQDFLVNQKQSYTKKRIYHIHGKHSQNISQIGSESPMSKKLSQVPTPRNFSIRRQHCLTMDQASSQSTIGKSKEFFSILKSIPTQEDLPQIPSSRIRKQQSSHSILPPYINLNNSNSPKIKVMTPSSYTPSGNSLGTFANNPSFGALMRKHSMQIQICRK